MKTTIQLLAGIGMFALVACGSGSGTVGSAEAGLVTEHPAVKGSCGPENKVDAPGDQENLCAEGEVASVICVKAGNTCFCADESENNGCYDFDLEAGSVKRVGSGRDCQGISHTEFDCEEPLCPKGQKPCMVDSDCEKGEMCDEGCCVPEPPKCDIPCDDKGGCPDKLMCDNGCCV